MTSHKFKLKNVWQSDYMPDAWCWYVHWSNGLVWQCMTDLSGNGIYRIDEVDKQPELAPPDKFTLANCTRSQVYRRIHKVFDKMKVLK